jgi:hypothetical protein
MVHTVQTCVPLQLTSGPHLGYPTGSKKPWLVLTQVRRRGRFSTARAWTLDDGVSVVCLSAPARRAIGLDPQRARPPCHYHNP